MRMQPTSSFLGLLTVANNQKFQILVFAQGINGLRDQGRALQRHESADEQHFCRVPVPGDRRRNLATEHLQCEGKCTDSLSRDVEQPADMFGIGFSVHQYRSEEQTSAPVTNAQLVCRLLLEKK